MNAYFEALLKNNNVHKSQLFLVDDTAALPASELLRQLHDDESSSSDQVPATRVSCASIDISSSRHSFNLETEGDNEIMGNLESSTWFLNLSESSIGGRQSDEDNMILSKSKTGKKKPDQQ
mmetsp:Transcript_5158/g.12328  ORF Transcript_5158/g.12328 Transcript_5158/m.12328 type:complete len:121 (+) Transcript_5158:273-635(+)|eukprot:CAMPEP_0113631918 /NCGR_PEP_ID=MMETSP0017_2-20120614/16586_1 /TAXON_ID=2856 /ORGANISM="Cylindrotheca closterium" /LENGTH=120 /DNA_ID=CAMNT_0000542445 /DNA_START=238 /DNA_END=600 /DNA_ORIENTATION=- /assembly_acc=CAM_ASM_000147